jgi:hypothetical protein
MLEQRLAVRDAHAMVGLPWQRCDGQLHPSCPLHGVDDAKVEQSSAEPWHDCAEELQVHPRWNEH